MLETPAWTFRPLTLADIPAFYDWYNDRQLHEAVYTRPFQPVSEDELMILWKKKLGRIQADYYAVCVGEQVVGGVGFKKSPYGDLAEFSILIGPGNYRGRGLGTAVTKSMVDLAFLEEKIKLVRLYVRRDNTRAFRCYEKVGFRSVFSFTQNGIPTQMMQIERREWESLRAERTDVS